MSGIINIYEGDARNFSCEGLGTLCPMEWTFENKGNDGAVLKLVHPYDALEKWRLIDAGRIIKAEVPVRTVPEIEAGAMIATAERWKVKATATSEERALWSEATEGRKKATLPGDAQVIVTQKGEERYKVKHSRYGTGWVDAEAMECEIVDVPYSTVAAVEAATPSVRVRAQLFRLQEPKRTLKTIEVEALPIAYDAAGVLTNAFTQEAVTGPECLQNIKNGCYIPTPIRLATDIGDSRTGFDKRDVNVIDALLNGEDSFVGRFGGEVLFDDYEITILRSAGLDRGFYASYGRNLTGVDSLEVADDVVTAVLPVGENEDGTPLYLTGQKWIAAPNYNDYPVPHMAALKVSEARVNTKEGITVAVARARMLAAAQAEFSVKQVHLPAVTLKISFAFLGDSEEYKRFKALDQCHMYDVVHVWHPRVCGEVALQVCECVWDGMRGRYTGMTLGMPTRTMTHVRVSARQISGQIVSNQIAYGAIAAANLANGAITSEKLGSGAVTADKLAGDISTFRMLLTDYSPTEAQLVEWSADGYEAWWTTTTATTGIRVGDVIALRVADAARGGYASIVGAVTETGGTYTLKMVSRSLLRSGASGATGARGASTWALGTNYSYTTAEIALYGAAGYEGVWTIADAITGVQVGDVAMVRVANADTGKDAIILATVLQVIAGNNQLRLRSVGVMG